MPDDSEVYTHRSGRTGRAGKRGTSICIVHSRERGRIREVERLIQKEFVRGTLPSPKEICSKQLWKVIDDIERVEVDDEEIEEFLPEVRRKLEWLDKEDLLKRLVSREFGRFLAYYANAPEIEEVGTEKKEKSGKEKKGKENDGRKVHRRVGAWRKAGIPPSGCHGRSCNCPLPPFPDIVPAGRGQRKRRLGTIYKK